MISYNNAHDKDGEGAKNRRSTCQNDHHVNRMGNRVVVLKLVALSNNKFSGGPKWLVKKSFEAIRDHPKGED